MLIIWSTDYPAELNKLWRTALLNSGVRCRFTSETVIPVTEKDDLLFVMSAKGRELIEKAGWIPKKKTIGYLRDKFWAMPSGAKMLFSYSTGVKGMDWALYQNLLADVKKAIRYACTGSEAPNVGEYKWVDDFAEVIDYVKSSYEKTGKAVPLSCDLETLGLDRYNKDAWIISIFFTGQRRTAHGLYFEKGQLPNSAQRQQIEWLLSSPLVALRGANLKYDINWLVEKWSIHCTNFKMDTMLVGSLIDENRSNSLNSHAHIYTDFGGYDDQLNNNYDKGRMDLVPKSILLTYAGGDTDACLEVSEQQKVELLQDRALANFYLKLLHPAARAYEKVERVGVPVHLETYLKLEQELIKYLNELREKAREIIGNRLYYKHVKEDGTLNLTKASLLIDYMFTPNGINLKPLEFTEKTGEPVTSLDHLNQFKDHPKAKDFIALLSEFSSANKMLTTYVAKRDEDNNIVGGFLSHLRYDGRFHPTYFMYAGDRENKDEGGTVTGRLSAKNPAYQTIPKYSRWAKKLRKAYIAPEGYVIMGRDYAQGELKIAACLAEEPTMLNAYLNGIDLHAVTGARMGGYDFDEFMKLKELDPDTFDSLRQLAKAGNFGLLYGMSAMGFVNYAYVSYGVKLTSQEGEDNRSTFFETYSALPAWHEKCKRIARRDKQISSPLGRVRHLPLISSNISSVRAAAERQSINSGVQATLSDMSLLSTAIWDSKGYMETAPIIGMVHDALYFLVPEEEAEFYYKESALIMENLPFEDFGWTPQLQFTSDAEFGYNMADMAKVKGGKLPDLASMKLKHLEGLGS